MDTVNQRAAQARDDDRDTDQEEIFGRLPNDWARTPKASAECLCMVAYRCTFADDKTQFGLWEDRLSHKPILVGGFGENVRARAIAEAVGLGWLDRPHNSKLPRGPGYRFSRPFDRLKLPADLTRENSHMVWRSWFDGSLSCGQMAALLYIQAGTGKGPGVYARELEERFGWSAPTTLTVLQALRQRGIVEMQTRREKGRVMAVTYIVSPGLGEQLPVGVPEQEATTHKKPGGGLPGDGSPRDGLPGDIRRNSPDVEDSPRHNSPSHVTLVPSGDGAPPSGRPEGMIFKREVQPLRPERIRLSGWKGSTPFFREHDLAHNGPVAGVMNLETWRRMLHQYGGAPQHLTTPATHQQALEIGHELSAQAAEGDAPVPVLHAMLALAAAICDAHIRDKEIRSLGFVVHPLMRHARYSGDPTWAYNLPRRRDLVSDEEFEAAFELARNACDAIDTWEQELSVDRDQLLGTWEVECLAWSGKHFGRGALVDAMKHVRDKRMWAGKLLDSWRYFDHQVEPAKAAKAAAAAPPPQPAPSQPVRQGAGWEADVEEACNWLRTHLGTSWHKSHRLKGAAKEAGISREACRAAMERVERQTISDHNYQWITALPGVPRPTADDGDIIGTIMAADRSGLVANRLYGYGAEPLLAYVRSQAEKHGCTQDDVINDILDVLRLASSSEYGARQRVLESLIGANCGIGKPRYDVTHWTDFDRLVGRATSQKEKTG